MRAQVEETDASKGLSGSVWRDQLPALRPATSDIALSAACCPAP